MKLAVLGAGAWGTAISISLVQRHGVALWARDAQQALDMMINMFCTGHLTLTERALAEAPDAVPCGTT